MPRALGLRRQERDWDDLALVDPLWAVLSEMQPGERAWQLDRFFERGEADVEIVLRAASELGCDRSTERALDFGCGVGRLTRALGACFDEVVGVDISERMLEHARRLHADRPALHFVVNRRPDLRLFEDGTFDLVLSFVVLQHVGSAEQALAYVREFVRVARPGGLIAFQLPAPLDARRRLQARRRAYGVLRALGLHPDFLHQRLRLHPIRMVGVPEEEVRGAVAAGGGRVARADPDELAPGVPGYRYYVTIPLEAGQVDSRARR
ncbi:MAG: class I SAM-dependent methyltransferase [Gaiellaceae bacterium]